MVLKKKLIIKKKSEKINKGGLYSLQKLGCFHSFLLKRKIALDVKHPTGGLRGGLFSSLQDLCKKKVVNQSVLKENYFIKIKQLNNYRFTRLERNLPLRGQRTHTNAKTRKERKII